MIKTQLISFRKSASFPYKQAPLLRVKSHQCEDERRYMKAEAWLILLLPPFPSTTMQQLQISFLKTLLPPSIKHLFMLPAEKPLRSCDHMQNYVTRNWWKFCYRRQICTDLSSKSPDFGWSHASHEIIPEVKSLMELKFCASAKRWELKCSSYAIIFSFAH